VINLDENQLYEGLSEILEPLLSFFEMLHPEEVRICILYTILCSARKLNTIDALGVIERAKFLLLTTDEPSQDDQLPSFVV